jgi:NAD(P)-dependent dehydrogenase (short-subunit alcohol dehydrogenase family)
MEIRGRCALVTDAGAGIGRAIAHRLAQEGARVSLVDVDPAAAAETVGEITAAGGEAAAIVADLAVPAEVTRAVSEAAGRHGRLDILVNNAGGYASPVFPDAPAEHWMRTVDLNLRAPMLAIHAALPMLVRDGGGAVVNIASSAGVGIDPHPGPEYAAAKAALIRLTTCLGPLRERMVRVNCICPHTVGTDAVLEAIAGHTARGEPLPADLQGDLIDVGEVARVAVELIQADGMAGRVIALSGGRPPRLLHGPSII